MSKASTSNRTGGFRPRQSTLRCFADARRQQAAAAGHRLPAVCHQLGLLQPAYLRGGGVRGAVVGEYLASSGGVGYLILQAEGVFDINTVFAGIVVLTVCALVLDGLVGVVEQRLLVWRPSQAATDARAG
jgi:hypothetical protein